MYLILFVESIDFGPENKLKIHWMFAVYLLVMKSLLRVFLLVLIGSEPAVSNCKYSHSKIKMKTTYLYKRQQANKRINTDANGVSYIWQFYSIVILK